MTPTEPFIDDPLDDADVRLSTVSRGPAAESTHRGALVVLRGDEVLASYGAVDKPVWTRSVVKPFQALASLVRGIDLDHGLDAGEVAVMSASHDGTPAHVERVRAMMAKLGIDEGDLGCGPHAPYHKKSSIAIARAGGKPQRIHNNCSGKHTAMLWLARTLGVPAADYLEPDVVSQLEIRATIAQFLGLDAESLPVAIDGCGAPTFRVPLRSLARGFARVVNPDGMPDVVADGCRRLMRAIASEPAMFEGDGEFCTELLRALPAGSILPKNGAEGVFVIGLNLDDPGAGPPIGIAVKVGDGAPRGYWPVLVDLLASLGAFGSPARIPDHLADFARVPVRNTQKKVVGFVESSLRWPSELAGS